MKKIIGAHELNGFGERIEEAMIAKGLNQAQLAEKLGVSRSAISQFVHEKRCPSRQVIIKMANVLSVSVDLLMGRTSRSDFSKLLQNDSIRTLVARFSRLTITDQERVLDILDLLERTTAKKSDPRTGEKPVAGGTGCLKAVPRK